MNGLVAKLARQKPTFCRHKLYVVSAMLNWSEDTTIWATEEDADQQVAALLAGAGDLQLHEAADPDRCLREWRSPQNTDFIRVTTIPC